MTPEGKVKNQVKKVLTSMGAFYFMPVGRGYGRSGIPDIIACYRGMFVGIETKADGGTATPLQLKCLEEIKEAGGLALVVHPGNVAELSTMLEQVYADLLPK